MSRHTLLPTVSSSLSHIISRGILLILLLFSDYVGGRRAYSQEPIPTWYAAGYYSSIPYQFGSIGRGVYQYTFKLKIDADGKVGGKGHLTALTPSFRNINRFFDLKGRLTSPPEYVDGKIISKVVVRLLGGATFKATIVSEVPFYGVNARLTPGVNYTYFSRSRVIGKLALPGYGKRTVGIDGQGEVFESNTGLQLLSDSGYSPRWGF